LHCERDPIAPLSVVVDETFENGRREELSDSPAEVDICSEVATKSKRADLCGVSGTHSRKHTPWNTAEEFSDPQDLNVWRKEDDLLMSLISDMDSIFKLPEFPERVQVDENRNIAMKIPEYIECRPTHEDESRHSREVDQHDFSMTVFRGEVPVEQSTDNVANSPTILQASLPRTGELVAVLGSCVKAVFLLESRVCEEAADEGGIVALHDDGRRHHDGPEDGFLVRLDGLPEAETVFGGGGGPGILVQGFVVETHVRVVDVGLLDIVDIVLDVCHCHDGGSLKKDFQRRFGI
jgi:hypothetical protein